MHFPGLEKLWILGKMAEVIEKSWNLIFLSNYWKHCPCHRAKIYLKKAGFSPILSHGKFKLVIKKGMEKSLNFIAHFLCEPCYCLFVRKL